MPFLLSDLSESVFATPERKALLISDDLNRCHSARGIWDAKIGFQSAPCITVIQRGLLERDFLHREKHRSALSTKMSRP